MTRLKHVGFEGHESPGTTQLLQGAGSLSGLASLSIETTIARSPCSMKIDSTVSNGDGHCNPLGPAASVPNSTGSKVYFARAYIYITAYPSSSAYPICGLIGFAVTDGSNDIHDGIGMDSSGFLYAVSQDNASSASNIAVPLNEWHRIEFKVTYAITANTSRACTVNDVQLDGASLGLTVSHTVTTATPQTSASGLILETGWIKNSNIGGPVGPGASKIIYVDDVALNDDQGASQNSYPGEGRIGFLLPTSDSARGVWTGGAGGTTNLFDALNNTPPAGLAAASETNTSQIKSAGSGSSSYDANMGAYTDPVTSGGLGIPPGSTIAVVQLITVSGSEQTSADSGSQIIVSNPAQGAADTITDLGTGSAIGTYATNWKANFGTIQAAPAPTLSTKPVCRISKTQSQARTADCCFMGLLVEWAQTVNPIARPRTVQQAINRAASY